MRADCRPDRLMQFRQGEDKRRKTMAKRLIGAVEAGGTKFILALADEDGQIIERARIATEHPSVTMPAMAEFFHSAASRHGVIAAFGIASFGPIDIAADSPGYGTFTTTPKPGWSGARFQDALGSFEAPIIVDTDVNGAAIGEWLAGAGQGCRTLAYTTVGTGIGTGVVRDGKSLMGISHFESGHIIPPQDRARDPFSGICPFHGACLEGLASGPAIIARYGESLDKLGPAAVELIAGYVAHLAATLVLIHMPDRLIFGGGVMKSPGLLDSVRKQAETLLAGYVSHPRLQPGLASYIVGPGLGDDAGIAGAVALGQSGLA
jgi:fructokinase